MRPNITIRITPTVTLTGLLIDQRIGSMLATLSLVPSMWCWGRTVEASTDRSAVASPRRRHRGDGSCVPNHQRLPGIHGPLVALDHHLHAGLQERRLHDDPVADRVLHTDRSDRRDAAVLKYTKLPDSLRSTASLPRRSWPAGAHPSEQARRPSCPVGAARTPSHSRPRPCSQDGCGPETAARADRPRESGSDTFARIRLADSPQGRNSQHDLRRGTVLRQQPGRERLRHIEPRVEGVEVATSSSTVSPAHPLTDLCGALTRPHPRTAP